MKKRCRVDLLVTAFVVLALLGCTSTGISPTGSKTFNLPPNAAQAFRVVYLDNNLGAQTEHFGTRLTLSNVGYEAFGPTLKQRVPLISAQSGLDIEMDSEIRQFYTREGRQKEMLRAIQKNIGASILVLQATSGSILSQTYNSIPTTGHAALVFNADFIDTTTNTLLWNGKFDVQLGVGFPAPAYVNGNFVDKLLNTVIGQLQNDGIVAKAK